MFSWRNKENYLWIIFNTPSYPELCLCLSRLHSQLCVMSSSDFCISAAWVDMKNNKDVSYKLFFRNKQSQVTNNNIWTVICVQGPRPICEQQRQTTFTLHTATLCFPTFHTTTGVLFWRSHAPRLYTVFFMLNSAKHGIFPVYKY